MQTLSNDYSHANGLFAQAANFDLSAITDRYKREFKVSPEIARLHELECKKYLLLCALFPEERIGMKGPVDNYWHTFLLFTKEYSSFCQQIAKAFIHHVPATAKAPADGLLTTMNLYRSVFGVDPDSRAWPHRTLDSSDCGDLGDSCSDGPGPGDCTPTSDCNGGRCAPY